MEKTATFTRWLCYSHAKDGFKMGNGSFTKDANRAKVYLRKPSTKSYVKSLQIVPVKIECTIDLEALTYTKITGSEYE
ncbi:MAG: hypothetical protein CMP47_12345 [Rickettsiales bacterium]|nr:hypothetical protein [Rickettsiales bacterium]|tara:strand:+ start:1348 stop:1581 length:234 start_codon:yes stop_codon:yes gene_type:complete